MSLRVRSKVSKDLTIPCVSPWFVLEDQDVSSQLPPLHLTCLPAAILPAMAVMDSTPLQL